jgi:hypothetical protein
VYFVDLERRIVDAMVIVLRAFEHDGAALESVSVFGIRQIALAESSEITLVFMIAESNRFP